MNLKKKGNIDTRLVDIIINFVKRNGIIMVLSNDRPFTSSFLPLLKDATITNTSCLAICDNEEIFKTKLKEVLKISEEIVLFFEVSIDGQSTIETIEKVILGLKTKIKTIALLYEVEKHQFTFLREIGVKNFKVKPLSRIDLLETLALTVQPDTKFEQLAYSAQKYLAQKNPSKAIACCQEMLRFKKDSPTAFVYIGDAYRQIRQLEQALKFYKLAIREKSYYLDPLIRLADLYKELGNEMEELKYLEKLNQISPYNVERKFQLAEKLVKYKRVDEGKKEAEEAQKIAIRKQSRETKDVLSRIGRIFIEADPAYAVSKFREALDSKNGSHDKGDIKTFNFLGIALRKQGKWQEAIEEYKRALKIDSKDANLFYNISFAYYEGKAYERSANALSKSLELDPLFHQNNVSMLLNISLIFYKSKKLDESQEFGKMAINIDPENERAKNMLKTIYNELQTAKNWTKPNASFSLAFFN